MVNIMLLYIMQMESEASCQWYDIYHTLFIATVSLAYVSTHKLIST